MKFVHPSGSLRTGPYDVCVADGVDEMSHTSLRVLTLGTEPVEFDCGEWEFIVLGMRGLQFEVRVTSPDGSSQTYPMHGRADPLSGPSDVLYAPPNSTLAFTSDHAVTIALGGAKPTGGQRFPVQYRDAEEVPIEERGAGRCQRFVRNFGVPGVIDADSLIACEVVTPAGNTSSYPPHKHDTDQPGVETALEEIYYFDEGSVLPPGVSVDHLHFQRVYASDDRAIDVTTTVRPGDVVNVPYGWHGPSVAAPTADLYYLNVMAGPGAVRAWQICEDPDHAAVRDTWTHHE